MDSVITPQPHFIPGYTGHCPQYRFRVGMTYGKLTHKLLIDPCVNHAPELIVTQLNKKPEIVEYPTQEEVNVLKSRVAFIEPLYVHPIIPGYEGFIPNLTSKIGKRFIAAATAGIAEHEQLMDLLRCERRFLIHRDILESGVGLFEHKLYERLMPMATYRAPLQPVRPQARAQKELDCNFKEKKEPYSKFTVPHFMEDDDEEKYIVSGYGGHIPMALTGYGLSSKQLTNRALCEFTNQFHKRRRAEWCPQPLPGVGSTCPSTDSFVIYHRSTGMVPSYAGHVPGELFTFGKTYGNSTVDAKGHLERHKDIGI